MRVVNKVQQITKKALQITKGNIWLFLLFALSISGAVSLQVLGKDVISSLGENLLSELIGAALTAYGIDYLIERRERRKLLPLLASSYEDVRIMTHWALELWKNAYTDSVGDSKPGSWQELLSEESLDRVQLSMDIRRPAKVTPTMTWGAYIDMRMDEIHKHAEKILERHGHALDPDIHSAIYSIVYYKNFKIIKLLSLDRMQHIPRPFNLGSYMLFVREWFDSVISLHEWTIEMHKHLKKNGICKIHAPYVFSSFTNTAIPPAKLDHSELMQQFENFKLWQQQQSQKPTSGH